MLFLIMDIIMLLLLLLWFQHTLAGWRKVFWVAAGINVGGALFYTIFGSGKIQPWALTEEERAEAEKKRSTSIST